MKKNIKKGCYLSFDYMCQNCGEEINIIPIKMKPFEVAECPKCGKREMVRDRRFGYGINLVSI